MFNKKLLRLPLQFFAEDGTDEPTVTNEPDNTPLNFDELLKTDKSFQTFMDLKIQKSIQTALQNDREKQRRLADTKLTIEEKMKGLSAEDRAEEWRKMYEQEKQLQTKKAEAEVIKSRTMSTFTEKKIPVEFLDEFFDFENLSAEDIERKIGILAKHEYYTQGGFETEQKRRLDEALKQKPPETHTNNNPTGITEAEKKAWGL